MGKITERYPFRRSFYQKVEDAIQNSAVSFLLEPRKCGKTICLKQIEDAVDQAIYVDLKTDFPGEEQKRMFLSQVMKAIQEGKKRIYLIDEATYLPLPDKDILRIAAAALDNSDQGTKVVFAGSQSTALNFWGHLACAGNASYIHADFLSYPEWMAYRGITEVSEDTYLKFLGNTREFYPDFQDVKEYLQGCLDETVLSNQKAVEYVMGNGCEDLTVQMLLDVLYASLIKLHNHTSYVRFADARYFGTALTHFFPQELLGLQKEILEKRIQDFLSSRYHNFSAMTALDCKNALRFLQNCGLITLTYVSDELNVDPYLTEKILKESNDLYQKPEIFSRINAVIRYPMFYLKLIKGVLQETMGSTIPRELLGSIVECHVRSLLPESGCFSYRDADGAEIDYVSLDGKALECSVFNKKIRDTNFHLLPDSFEKILLTRDQTDPAGRIRRIPYYQFIYERSDGKELVEVLREKEEQQRKEEGC